MGCRHPAIPHGTGGAGGAGSWQWLSGWATMHSGSGLTRPLATPRHSCKPTPAGLGWAREGNACPREQPLRTRPSPRFPPWASAGATEAREAGGERSWATLCGLWGPLTADLSEGSVTLTVQGPAAPQVTGAGEPPRGWARDWARSAGGWERPEGEAWGHLCHQPQVGQAPCLDPTPQQEGGVSSPQLSTPPLCPAQVASDP